MTESRAQSPPGLPPQIWEQDFETVLVLLYANVPALIMPTLHPKIAHVLSEKDRALNGTEDLQTLQAASRRLFSTYEMVMGIVFAGPEADDVAHGLHELHRPISGTMPDGASYHAWNKDVWNWTWGSTPTPAS